MQKLKLLRRPSMDAAAQDAREAFATSLGAHSLAMTANRLCDCMAEATPGTVLIYHLGMLARDRVRLPEGQRQEVQLVADQAMAFAEQGRAHLLQRRIGQHAFAYLLVVRPIAGPRLAPVACLAVAACQEAA